MNEIVEPFGLGQIQLAVLKRTAREFAGFGRPQPIDSAERLKQRSKYRAPAVNMKFGSVLPCCTGRPREPQNYGVIDRPELFI